LCAGSCGAPGFTRRARRALERRIVGTPLTNSVKSTLSFELGRRWPDATLSRHFQTLLQIYEEILSKRPNGSLRSDNLLGDAYRELCAAFQQSAARRVVNDRPFRDWPQLQQKRISALVEDLQRLYGADWLQAVASMFAMLMHFSLPAQPTSRLLVNRRRPKQSNSSYPNSPALARMLAERVVSHLLKLPIPSGRISAQAAERYAEKVLAFRVVDPSMESGQLLLEMARAVIRRVRRKKSLATKSAAHLQRALLEKLCSDCLWGVDRNPQAIDAVRLAFSLFSRDCGVGELWPANVFTADSLQLTQDRIPLDFDAVINNPPWGDRLRATERRLLRTRFTTIECHADTYVAFGELALKWLRPGGIFALVLPSQMLATQNTARLRQLIAHETELDEIVLLPRSAFVQATVRAVAIIGRRRPAPASVRCRVITYPIIKSLRVAGPIRAAGLCSQHVRQTAGRSWWPLVAGIRAPQQSDSCLPLFKLARVISGVKVYARGEGKPRQTAAVIKERRLDRRATDPDAQPAIRGRNVRDFQIERPTRYIKLGPCLAHEGEHRLLLGSTRIFIRELCRRDGKLTAAITRDGTVPLHGVLTIVPERVGAKVLSAILNSQSMAHYVRGGTASFSKVDFQKITIAELQQMPIPVAAINPKQRAPLSLPPATRKEVSLQRQLVKIVKNLSQKKSTQDRKAFALFESIVQRMYRTR
jgi:predicted RNA methylase